MKIGYLGLGKMGQNMVLRLLQEGIEIVAWNRSPEPAASVKEKGAQIAHSPKALLGMLPSPKIVWLMLPAGDVTQEMIDTISPHLNQGDYVIDGANSFYKDSIRRGQAFEAKGINFLDIGVSGGPGGAKLGACLMVGGKKEHFEYLKELVKAVSAPDSYMHFEGIGAGHFVKMVHNGIEYGMMQAIAEGFEVAKKSDYHLKLADVASIYNRRSVIESRLIEWAKQGFEQYGEALEDITSTVAHSGEGEWTIQTAKELNIPVPVIEASFNYRVQSATNPRFAGKVLSMLRNMFGGHATR